MSAVFMFLIRIYQKCISPMLPPSCRFYPTCSEYAYQAFQIHGFFKGFWLAIKRIGKCHPFHPGGYDPVPCRAEQRSEQKDSGKMERSEQESAQECVLK